MNVLVTGAAGFLGKNLVTALQNIKDGKDRTYGNLKIDEIFCYDVDGAESELDDFCRRADFVFNLAGVNRPADNSEFMKGNFGFASELLERLKKHNNKASVMLASSVQATLAGRFKGSPYGESKKAGEELFFGYGEKEKVKVYVYRFPNVFGKWCKPNYNSAVATFCHNTANDLPVTINDRNTLLELVYIDDLIRSLINLLSSEPEYCFYEGTEAIKSEKGKFCYLSKTYKVTLGEIVDLLNEFKAQPKTLFMPELKKDGFAKKLFSTYLSYLPPEKAAFDLKENADERGSFTELIKTVSGGQMSVNVSLPSVTKGNHYHNGKWEMFIVVYGTALIRERKIGTDEVTEYKVSGDKLQAVYMLPGYTHSITNLSDTEKLITLMWANENFDKDFPDTFREEV